MSASFFWDILRTPNSAMAAANWFASACPAGFLGTTLLFGLLAGLGLFLEGLADLLEVGEVVDDWHL